MSNQYSDSLIEIMHRARDEVAWAWVLGNIDDVKQANQRFKAVLDDYPNAERNELWFKAATRIEDQEIEWCEQLLTEHKTEN